MSQNMPRPVSPLWAASIERRSSTSVSWHRSSLLTKMQLAVTFSRSCVLSSSCGEFSPVTRISLNYGLQNCPDDCQLVILQIKTSLLPCRFEDTNSLSPLMIVLAHAISKHQI